MKCLFISWVGEITTQIVLQTNWGGTTLFLGLLYKMASVDWDWHGCRLETMHAAVMMGSLVAQQEGRCLVPLLPQDLITLWWLSQGKPLQCRFGIILIVESNQALKKDASFNQLMEWVWQIFWWNKAGDWRLGEGLWESDNRVFERCSNHYHKAQGSFPAPQNASLEQLQAFSNSVSEQDVCDAVWFSSCWVICSVYMFVVMLSDLIYI